MLKNLLYRKLKSLEKRIHFLDYGITYWRDAGFKLPSVIKVNGVKKKLRFSSASSPAFLYEFSEICINDCYHLRTIKKLFGNIGSIVDIGANQGLFALAARQQFKNSSITCYEPNEQLSPYLNVNSKELGAVTYYEAVTLSDCKVLLHYGETDLHTKTQISQTGSVAGTSFRKVIERAGGEIDLLKLDCEGAEWALFEDTTSWQNVKSVTMEYHLWAQQQSKVADLFSILKSLDFEIVCHEPLSDKFGIITAINNKNDNNRHVVQPT